MSESPGVGRSDAPVVRAGVNRRVLVSIVAVCVVVGVGVGLSVGLFIGRSPAPSVVAAPTGTPIVGLVPQPFPDQISVPVDARLAAARSFTSAASGVVRASYCAPGKSINSGAPVLVVNDRVVVGLHLDSPPWRDLSVGVKGADVTDLQNELVRLGYQTPVNGVYSQSTVAAVKKLWVAAGAPSQSTVPLAQIVWLPEVSETPSVCGQQVGDFRGVGDVVFTTGGQLEGLTVRWPDGVWPGDRIANLDAGVSAPIGGDGAISDPGFLAAYVKTRGYIQWLGDDSNTLTVQTQLATPIQVVAVPPAGLYNVQGGDACLVDGGNTAVAVQIVASQLGETFVTGPMLPAQVVSPAPRNAPSCR